MGKFPIRKVLTGGNACEIAWRGVDRVGEVVAQSFIEMYTITVDQPGLSVHRSSPSERRTVLGATAVFVRQILASVRRAVCSLRGHDLMMEFAPTRLSLRCAACGYNTPGWDIDVKMPPINRQPRIRVVARTAPAAGKETMKAAAKTQLVPVQSAAADHANAA